MGDAMLRVLSGCGSIFGDSYVVSDFRKEDRPLVYVNDSFLKLTGYDKEEVINRNCRFLQGDETNSLTVKQISESLKKGESGWYDVLNYKKNGEMFWNRLTLIPISYEMDPVRFYLGIQQDVTELKKSKHSINEYGPLVAAGKNLTAPLLSILNASRSLKYFNDGSGEADAQLEKMAMDARKEVAKITQYVRDLG